MTSGRSKTRLAVTRLVPAMAFLLLVQACGGGDDRVNASVDSNSTSLLDDEGAPAASDPQERPTDKAAWTTRGLYASDAQAQVLVAALGDAGLTVDVACCGVEILHTTVEATLAKRAELGLPMDAPVFVRASDLRLSATVADRLSRDGLMNVWVVTP